ncbi:uncharacterized protein LOC127774860 [Oryza glaberrima]|uniref:uncharacterized protein LOC127774860 n=1 Tax=Oryza glaberrima TaxID=4538 RepID=UPI00224C4048|nr:uncharacterized protein LOC127774860 [Oryza glaberrima]
MPPAPAAAGDGAAPPSPPPPRSPPESPDEWPDGGDGGGNWLHFVGVSDLTLSGGDVIYGRGHRWWARACKAKHNSTEAAPKVRVYFFVVRFDQRFRLAPEDLDQKDGEFAGAAL